MGAAMLMSAIRTLVGILPAAILAIPAFGYSIFSMGLPLMAFFALLLVFGWALGIGITAALLRYGLAAENIAWLLVFAFAPISGIYYPVSTLPEWLQPLAWALPAAHVFEGMRAVLFDGVFRTDLFVSALLLDLVYLAAAAGLMVWSFAVARRDGLLLRTGE